MTFTNYKKGTSQIKSKDSQSDESKSKKSHQIMTNAVNMEELDDESVNSSMQSVMDNIDYLDKQKITSTVDEKEKPYFNAFKKQVGFLVKKD